ncbi:MAG: hypothetical protein Q4F11_02700 [Eubacteriales bacterium]|nr:hypothetical protein [Eubacteriales bacterium]
MDFSSLEEVKKKYSDFQKIFESGQKEKAADMLDELLCALEDNTPVRRAGNVYKDGHIGMTREDGRDIYMSLNHVMEYYIYAYYFKPQTDVRCTELPYGAYYRTYGELCLELGKYHGAEKAFIKAVGWNPVDLDAILGLAESYKYTNKIQRYLDTSKMAYRYCCTRATMARYYRNMGYYFLNKYETDLARACYIYSNIYYHTDNADSELEYLKSALKDETPDFSIRQMQQMFAENDVEPGPDPDTIGIVYRVGELMMEDKELKLAKDCFSIVYDITQEEKLGSLLDTMKDI